MILEGHADYATPEDLEGLDTVLLYDIAKLCEVEKYAPDECVPCLAGVMVEERRAENERALLDAVAERHDAIDAVQNQAPQPVDWEKEAEIHADASFPPALELATNEEITVVERFAREVKSLQNLVEELLEGPPIPPPNVTTEELALLAVAAQRWVRITEAQGVELAPSQEALLNATKALTARLNRG